MVQIEINLLLDTLKKALSAKKWTYKAIGKKLNLSETTIKRIFSNYDCSLTRLSQICNLIGITIIELGEMAKSISTNENYFLNKQQESFFVKHPSLLAIFRSLYRGYSPEKIKKEWNLNKNSFFKTLLEFEKLGLLEVLPDNKYKFKITGRLRFKLNGKLFNKIIKPQTIDFINTVYENIESEDCSFHSAELQMTAPTMKKMIQEINELGVKYRSLSYLEERTMNKQLLKDVKWIFAFLPYTTDWHKY